MTPTRKKLGCRHCWLAFCFLLAPGLTALAADTITGRVVGVTDGDTITVRTTIDTIKVRLSGIDTPERGQPFGTKAKQALSGQVFGKDVTINSSGEDRYGRTLGEIIVGGESVNLWLVRTGWAWWYERYAPDDTQLRDAQQAAQQAKLGLWADANPVPPWD